MWLCRSDSQTRGAASAVAGAATEEVVEIPGDLGQGDDRGDDYADVNGGVEAFQDRLQVGGSRFVGNQKVGGIDEEVERHNVQDAKAGKEAGK